MYSLMHNLNDRLGFWCGMAHSILSRSEKYLVFSQKIHTVIKNLHRSLNKVTGISICKDLLAYFPYYISYLGNSWESWQMLIMFRMSILPLVTTSSVCQQGRCGLLQHQHVCVALSFCVVINLKKCNLCYSFLCNTNIAVIQNLCLPFSIIVINRYVKFSIEICYKNTKL